MTISIQNVKVYVYRAPIDTPVMTSFGSMYDRPAVIVRLEDADGSVGWGEVWCNYPTCGAEHRARLVESVFAPLLLKTTFEHPMDAFDFLTDATHVLGIQTAEIGPIAQSIAGIDIAIWDLFAKQKNKPLYQLLGGTEPEISVYASGINPTEAAKTIGRARDLGYNAFKVKIGFGHEADIETLKSAYAAISESEKLMADANQAWKIDEAIEFLRLAQDIPLGWLEEPIQADRPENEWQKLSTSSKISIAAGENIRGVADFDNKIASATLGVIQPDICKWGGISVNLPIVQSIINGGVRYCPHYLGGGIGLIASAHLLAAVGGDGMLEVDINTNPLREKLAEPFPNNTDGKLILNADPGLGVAPDLATLGDLCVYQAELKN